MTKKTKIYKKALERIRHGRDKNNDGLPLMRHALLGIAIDALEEGARIIDEPSEEDRNFIDRMESRLEGMIVPKNATTIDILRLTNEDLGAVLSKLKQAWGMK